MDRQTMAIEVKKALSETVLLSDGKYGYIITELHDPNGYDKWECHVCQRVISTERAMLMHLSHPLHMNKLRAPQHPVENFRKKSDVPGRKDSPSKKKDDKNSWESPDAVRPGEPIPPGMEDVVKKVCQIQDALDAHPGPLVGLEYIVELISTEEANEPKYICLLCEKKGDPRSVMVHLTCHNHALRYISCFFRTAGNALNMIPKVRENRKGIAYAVQKIAEEIEKHFGRLKPTTAVAETFSQQKYDILRSIDEKVHFRETPTTTFVEYCTPEKIKEFAACAEAETFAKNNVDRILKSLDEKDQPENKKPVKAEPGDKSRTDDLKKNEMSKLSFSLRKPERSFGHNKEGGKDDEKKDDDVIFISSGPVDPIEVQSMSSISSISDDDNMKSTNPKYPNRDRDRRRSRTRSRSRGPRRRSPRRRSPRRRSSSLYRESRYRSRSRSRSRGRYYRSQDLRYLRGGRDPYGRDRRSRSKERLRYEKERMDRDRYKKSTSMERRRPSPYSSKLKHGKSPSPYKTKYKSPEPKKKKVASEYQVKMDAYRAKLHNLEVEMDNKLKYYKERPEKHPQYSDEWKSFWNRRYKELQQSGKDPTGYDFKPEWILYWDERVKQLHEEELKTKKEELKSFLPVEEKCPSNDLQDISPPTPEEAKDVTVDDIKNTWKALTGSDIKAPPRQRSPTPESKSPTTKRSPSPWEDRPAKQAPRRGAATYVSDPPIVHCLRMLSVLEQQLGSLGPKALDLLSKAIIMEKVKPTESMKLLDDPDVHIFFETVKEKVRGQLIAGIVVRYLVNSCRSVITHIESMLAANPLKPKAPPPAPKPAYQPEPVKVAGVGMVNKMAVAQQIAEALIAQGRTDVSQQELEDLINAVVGIASNTNTNISQPSASLLSSLNLQYSTADPHINNLLSNIISTAQQSGTPQAAVQGTAQPVFPAASQVILPRAAQVALPVVPEATSHVTHLVSPQKAAPVVDKTLTEVRSSVPSISSLLSFPTLNQNSSKAFNEAVSAAKATVTEQVRTTPVPVTLSAVKDKPLFPSREPSLPPVKEQSVEKESPSKISDDDLRERLMKFKTLSRDEQQSLILLLKDLEGKEPERVEKLRKYVTAGLAQTSTSSSKPEQESGRLSPFSSRAGGTNPAPDERKKMLLDLEDDDDDYSVEDIYNTVSQNLKKKIEREPDCKLNDPDTDPFDENTSSSRYSNPPRPHSPLAYKNVDPRLQNSGSTNVSKSDYSVYSVGDLPPPSQSNSSSYPQSQEPLDNTYGASQYNQRDNQWSGNKSWSQGTQEMYHPQSARPNSFAPNSYDGNQYTQNSLYKAPSGQFYGNNQQPSYLSGQQSNSKPYPQQYGNQPQQNYPSGGMMHNAGAPGVNSYNYPRSQAPQGQNYYGNYRQY